MFSFYLTGLKKLLNLGKKIFIVLAVYFIVISLFFHFIAKDKPKITYDPIKKNREEIYKTINDPQLNKTQEGKLTIAIYRLILCGTIGEACSDNPSDGDKNFSHSLFGFMSNLIVFPYINPPASGIYWAYVSLQNAGFVPKTYAAQGIGFASIKALNKVWLVMRNFSFMILVLVIITIGFMIMFRTKLNPQTVISVENALPKIVITLILINFSFAIAGFLIDLMYLSMAIIISLLAPVINLDTSSTIGKYLTANIGQIGDLFSIKENIFSSLWNLGRNFINLLGLWSIIFYALLTLFLDVLFGGPFIFNKISDFLNDVIPKITGSLGIGAEAGVEWNIIAAIAKLGALIPSLILGFIGAGGLLLLIIILSVLATVLFLIFRIFFILLSAYIKILLLIIFSPLMILANALPGQSPFNFESWLKNLLAELITFPIVIAIFMVGTMMTAILSSENVLFSPPFLFNINPQSFIFIFGMGILFMAPDLIKTFKQLILPKPVPLPEFSPGVFIAGATTAVGGAFSEASKWGSIGMYVAPVRVVLEKFAPGIFKYQENK